MNNDLPPNIPPDFQPLMSQGFPMRQLKRLHRELTLFEMFIQMNAFPEELADVKKKVIKIYEVQELVEGYVIEETERLKIIKGK